MGTAGGGGWPRSEVRAKKPATDIRPLRAPGCRAGARLYERIVKSVEKIERVSDINCTQCRPRRVQISLYLKISLIARNVLADFP